MSSPLISAWSVDDAFSAAKKTVDLVHSATVAELRTAINLFIMDDNKCAVFTAALPESVRLTSLIEPTFVQLAITLDREKTLVALSSKALKDIMFTFIDASITIDESSLTRAYTSIHTTLHLGLLSFGRVMRNIVKYACKQESGEVLHTMYALFGEVCMYKNSSVDVQLRTYFSERKRDDLVECMGLCKGALLSSGLAYAKLDLSPRQGSAWLRDLVCTGEVDREEFQAGMTQNAAFVSRWFRYARSKYETKRGIMLERVDGLSLIEFAYRAALAVTKTPNANSAYLGHLLLLQCVYTVSVEHPDMLPPHMYAVCMKLFRIDSLYHAYRGMMSGLELRLSSLLSKPSLSFEELEGIAQRGLGWNRITQCVVDHSMRDANVVAWRVLLKACLRVLRESNTPLEITF